MARRRSPGSVLGEQGYTHCTECRHERHRHLRGGAGPCTAAIPEFQTINGRSVKTGDRRCKCPHWRAEQELW